MSADHASRQTPVRTAGQRPARDWASADFAQLRQRIHALVNDLMRGVLDAFVMASPAEIGELMRSTGPTREWDGTSFRFDHAAKATNGAVPAPAADRLEREDRPPASSGRGPRLGAEERTKPLKRNAAKRTVVHDSLRGSGQSLDRLEEAGRDARSSFGSHDPFDITSPSELLASAGSRTSPGEILDRIALSFDRAVGGGEGAPAASASEPSKPDDPRSAPPATPPQRTPVDSPVVAIDTGAASERRPRVMLREGERLLSATGSGVVIRRARR
ncbi:MAG TPA: hypothetical protein VN894_05925 [Polyangiaceae bacterium]|nr:hypothetical protein [Polyangiaceae bacterium]